MKSLRETAIIFFIIIVLASGMSIYVWNLIQGKNLAKPPEFDLSIYDELPNLDNVRDYIINSSKKALEPEPVQVIELPDEVQLAPGYIYFSSPFRLRSAEETSTLIKSFLSDFPSLAETSIEDLEAKILLEVEIPALEREEHIRQLEESPAIAKVAVLEPPIWQVKLNQGLYSADAAALIQSISSDLRIRNDFVKDGDFIARVKYEPTEEIALVLDRLEKEYSDVVKVIR
jgi:hypothetical protein